MKNNENIKKWQITFLKQTEDDSDQISALQHFWLNILSEKDEVPEKCDFV